MKTQYIGKSGEYFVAGHLLRLTLNITPLPVDEGIDLLGHRLNRQGETRTYLFQVKTTQNDTARINLQRSKFVELLDNAVNLIVVMWSIPEHPVALVIPPRLLKMMTTGGFQDPLAPLRIRGERVQVKVEQHNGRVYVRNRAHDFTGMVNRFDLVEATDIEVTSLPEYARWAEPPAAVQLDPEPLPEHNENTLGGEVHWDAIGPVNLGA